MLQWGGFRGGRDFGGRDFGFFNRGGSAAASSSAAAADDHGGFFGGETLNPKSSALKIFRDSLPEPLRPHKGLHTSTRWHPDDVRLQRCTCNAVSDSIFCVSQCVLYLANNRSVSARA